ncbi:Phosphatidylinositol 3-kinase regulatory subunit gamma [Desmophyllum pertusum]|uniref:Phosphatidylinositol 3-kinase regulatory subunit gamma n=1 Tax=Desmophyllum pertusum TaxID=174260 RepID=A0A9X0CFN6_9CNID|nr:Phosphatidylinositol 3-kinase regulatory subunit gamma [Desmophyllum pertusum]
MIVAKPVLALSGWLTGENARTREIGEFPATYVEYIGDVEELPKEETPPTPPPRPQRPPRRLTGGSNTPRANDETGGHTLSETSAMKPVWCGQCEDFIWGFGSQVYRCTACDLAWHPQCMVELAKFPCKIHKSKDLEEEEEDYIKFVTNPDEWEVNDVLMWLAATNHFLYAEVFRENEITGSQLRQFTDMSLNQLNITDSFHKHSLLLAIQELFTGNSETRKSEVFSGLQTRGSKGTSHLFKEQNFTSLQWCDKCGKCLWGFYRQGVLCSECGFQCHRKCMFDSVVVCPRRRVRIRRESDADVPVFGAELGAQFRPADKPAPTVVMKCVQAIERGNLIRTVGIYSIVPPGSEKNALKTALNQSAKNVNMDDEEWRNPHCVAAVLRMYLNELPTCVFTEEKYPSFVKTSKDENREAVGTMLMELVENLPQENKSVLMYLLRHFYKISQSVEWNDMSSKKLASSFAPILLRPNRQHIMALVANHEITAGIIDFLITNGEWTEKLPRRETVSERLKDQDDGVFIVRDSRRFPGEYTLTLRKGGVNKLIRILHKEGQYGFSEPLTFSSVVELINYYKTRSLASYNPKLDIRLETPLQKYEQDDEEEGGSDSGRDADILQRLTNVHQEFMKKSNDYDEIHNDFVQSEQEITDYHEELEAHREIVKIIDEQIMLHESFQKEAPPQNRAILRQNYELLMHKRHEAKGILITLDGEIADMTEKTRVLNKRMNSIKPDIIKLQRSKQQYYLVLTTEKGMEIEKVKEAIGEEGSERNVFGRGCDIPNGNPQEEDIYDVPEVDLAESQWLHGQLTREEAEELLKTKENGTFMIRESARRLGSYAVALKHKGAVKHIEVKEGTRGGYGFAANYTTHPTLCDLVKHYHVNTLQVHNPELDTTLKFPWGERR